MRKSKRECVILLHGLALSSLFMLPLKNSLEKEGYYVHNVDYPSTDFPISYLASTYVSKALIECANFDTIHFVTHSMGGIVLRYYLKHNSVQNLGNVVMLAPPNKGTHIVDVMKNFFLFRWIFGETAKELSAKSNSIPNTLGAVNFPLGIIAGNSAFNIVGMLLLARPHDGIVSVESTKVEGMKEHIILNVSHTLLLKNREVFLHVKDFLKVTKFHV